MFTRHLAPISCPKRLPQKATSTIDPDIMTDWPWWPWFGHPLKEFLVRVVTSARMQDEK